MGFLEVFVRRPVFTTMLVATGARARLFAQLGVDIFPKVDLPTITITTRLPGASPEEIESQITKPIEEVVNTISGLDELRSSTIEGQSRSSPPSCSSATCRRPPTTSARRWGRALRPARGHRLAHRSRSAPIMALVVSGQRSAREITEIADKRIKRALETVKDVGAITLVGDRKREIQILVNPDKLTAFNLSIQVKDRCAERGDSGGGSPRAATRKACAPWAASSRSRRSTTSSWPTSRAARPRARRRHGGGRGGGAAHALAPQRLQRGVPPHPQAVRHQHGGGGGPVKARLAEVQKGLPQDIQFEIVRDLSRFIKRSFHEVQDHLLLGGLLASLIVAAFIGRLPVRERGPPRHRGGGGAAFLRATPSSSSR